MKVKHAEIADHHGHVHEWSKCGVDKLECVSCCVQVHMSRQSLTIINFTVLVRSLYCLVHSQCRPIPGRLCISCRPISFIFHKINSYIHQY